MTTCLGKSCLFGLLCVNVDQFGVCASTLSETFGFEGGVWGLVLLIPDHCISLYF